MADLERTYNRFLNKEVVDPSKLGKDFCDMSGGYDRPLSEFNIINIMLPSKYFPPLSVSKLNHTGAAIYFRHSISCQGFVFLYCLVLIHPQTCLHINLQ